MTWGRSADNLKQKVQVKMFRLSYCCMLGPEYNCVEGARCIHIESRNERFLRINILQWIGSKQRNMTPTVPGKG
jgi:hypothetical protein